MKKNSDNESFAKTILFMFSICMILLTSILIFNPSDLTGLVIGGENFDQSELTNLAIIDDTDIEIKAFDEDVKFYARYTNIDTGNAIEDAVCTIYFNDEKSVMQFNTVSQAYEYTRSFRDIGLYNWNVTCTSDSFLSLTEKNSVIIGSISETYIGEIFSISCIEEWRCTDWGPCLLNGVQYRECFDLNRCDELYNKKLILHIERSIKPFNIQACVYEPTCEDMMFNNDESDVDCGGPCTKCEDGKICRTDNDCINNCDLETRRCYTPEEVISEIPVVSPEILEPTLGIPFKQKLIPILLSTFIIIFLIILVLKGSRYPADLYHRRVEYYKQRKEIFRIQKGAKEIERRKQLIKIDEERGEEQRRIREIEAKAIHEKEKERYGNQLDKFLSDSARKDYSFDQVQDMLISKGWPRSEVQKYFDIFSEKKKALIFGIEKKSAETKTKKISREITEKEEELQKKMDYFEDKLNSNSVYIEKELPKKWLIKVPVKKKDKEIVRKTGKKIKKIENSKELEKLQELQDYFENELKENAVYLQKKSPKTSLISSEIRKLIGKRKQILQEIKKKEEESESLQKLRFELERKEINSSTKKAIDALQKMEERLKDKLNQTKK